MYSEFNAEQNAHAANYQGIPKASIAINSRPLSPRVTPIRMPQPSIFIVHIARGRDQSREILPIPS